MTHFEQTQAMGRPAPIEPDGSPFWPRNLIELFVQPRRFFAGQLALGKTPYVLLVTWCYGMANAIDRVGTELMRAELGSPRPGWDSLAPFVVGSWWGFWAWVLASGIMSGAFLWYVGGWWYRVRLRWCGAVDPDPKTARLTFVYAAFVAAGPVVLLTLAQTLHFGSYAEAFSSDELWSVAFLIFPFWSVVTSYIGVRTLFDVSRWKARIWFAVLPALVYAAVLGLVATLFALLQA